MQINLALDHICDKIGKGLNLFGREASHIVGTEEITQVVDGKDAHSLHIATALRPEELIGDCGNTVKPDDAVRNDHLVSWVSAVGSVVWKVR